MSEAIPATGASEDRHSGFLVNVNLIFVSTLAVNALSFFIVIVIARLLGPEGRGITSLYQTGINATYAVISFGVSIGALYYVSRGEVTPRKAMESGLSATLGSAVLAAAGALVIGALFADEMAEADVPYWLVIVAIPLVVQFRLTEVLLRADGRFLVVSIVEFLVPAVVLLALLAVEFTAGLTVGRAIAVWSLAPLPSLLIAYAFLGPPAWPHRFDFSPTTFRLVRFGVQGQLGNIVQLLNYRLDSYLVLFFVDATGVGLYAVAVSLSEGLWLLANSVATVLIPKLTASGSDYAARTTPVICRNTLLVTALGALALAVLSFALVPFLFGNEFEDAVEPLLWLLPGVVAASATKVLAAYVFSQGRPMINTTISAVTLAVTLGADFVLIPTLGVNGAAISSTFAYAVSLVLTLYNYSRLSGGSWSEAILPRFADITLVLDSARSLAARLRSR
jgi:O-antigen/teichoic acid export membrane protein